MTKLWFQILSLGCSMKIIVVPLFACLSLAACTPASHHASQVRSNDTDRISVGKVQKEIKIGMSSANVVDALGSPNIVTTDDQRREQWVYDKIATESVYSTSSGGVGALLLAIPGTFGIGGGGGASSDTGAKSTQQRTLTVIVKFDNNSKVRDFAYHNSSF